MGEEGEPYGRAVTREATWWSITVGAEPETWESGEVCNNMVNYEEVCWSMGGEDDSCGIW